MFPCINSKIDFLEKLVNLIEFYLYSNIEII